MSNARIQIICPNCKHSFAVEPDEQGQVVDCPECHGYVDVPVLSREPTFAEINEAIPGRQAEQYQRLLDWDEKNQMKFNETLNRAQAVIAQWETLADRMGRLIDRMDRPSS